MQRRPAQYRSPLFWEVLRPADLPHVMCECTYIKVGLMVMSPSLISTILAQVDEESGRRAYPESFPVLPLVPAARYADPEFAGLERTLVFDKTWVLVAHSDELPETGDYRLVEALPQPIVLIRGKSGQISAFYNTCKHRGAALVSSPAGNTGRHLACPYHNWTYNLDGGLVGYPDRANFCDLDSDDHALTPIRCEAWGPLVFINLDEGATGLQDFLADVGADLSEMSDMAGRLHLAKKEMRDLPFNWKLPVDAFMESYHVNYIHRDTAAKALHQPSTGIQLLANGHSRMIVRSKKGMVINPGVPPLFEGLGDLPMQGIFSYFVYPNLTIVFVGPGFVFFITNWPGDGPCESSYHVHFCSSLNPANKEQAAFSEMLVDANLGVLAEDLEVLPSIQASVNSGTLAGVRLNYQERRIYYLHEAIDRSIGVEQIPDGLRVSQLLADFVVA